MAGRARVVEALEFTSIPEDAATLAKGDNVAKILVIDDDEILRTYAAECLRGAGHEVLTAEDGEQGLAVAATEKPECVITDLMMPGVHGFGVVEALRNNKALASIKIIVSSLKSYASDLQLAKNAGADRFLPKPYAPDALIAMVAELLGGNAIRVRFWGTRGSIATPGPGTARYGGNTSCTEVRCGDQILVFDAGTGIRELGNSLLREFGKNPIRAHIFVGHTHWDHIQGFPFFVPAYIPGNEIFVYSMRGAGKPLEKVFRGQMDSDYFPVLLSDMQAKLTFVELSKPVEIGAVRVAFQYLNHPGIALGFRVWAGGKSVVYVSDHEPFYRLVPGEAGEAEERKIVEFARDADLWIREAQYTEEEYASKKAWGHSTFDDALRAAAAAGVKRLAVFHHDPGHDDDTMDRIVAGMQDRIRTAGYSFTCSAAREGETIGL